MGDVVFHARVDTADGWAGRIRLEDETVEMVFKGAAPRGEAPNHNLPTEAQRVWVNGVERYYWLELTGFLIPRDDLRDVGGHDLRRAEIRVITTDDGRRYSFLADAALSRAVMARIPGGRRRTYAEKIAAKAA